MLRDLKEALSSLRKADTTHMRRYFSVYTSRPCEWGSVKYERANYLRSPGDGSMRAHFERFRAYLRAARDHIDDVLQSMEEHQANDPQLLDVEGMKRAAYAVDRDEKPNCEYGASLLPHVAPACSSLMMAVEQAVKFGLLPKDPGTPWTENAQHRAKRGLTGALDPSWCTVLEPQTAEERQEQIPDPEEWIDVWDDLKQDSIVRTAYAGEDYQDFWLKKPSHTRTRKYQIRECDIFEREEAHGVVKVKTGVPIRKVNP
jgi:hypothetical protein